MFASYFDQFTLVNIALELVTNSSLMLLSALVLSYVFFSNK